MVIAGAVACWFFTRNKSRLKSPIAKSFGNLLRYHMGTVAFGSFIIALVQFLRASLKLLMVGEMFYRHCQLRIIILCAVFHP